jgi:hypothetical protein
MEMIPDSPSPEENCSEVVTRPNRRCTKRRKFGQERALGVEEEAVDSAHEEDTEAQEAEKVERKEEASLGMRLRKCSRQDAADVAKTSRMTDRLTKVTWILKAMFGR